VCTITIEIKKQIRQTNRRDEMANETWDEIFGHYNTAKEIVAIAENSNITVADWLHSAYIEMYGNDPEHPDFDKLAEEVCKDAGIEY
jgi:hypothetical protein